MDVPLRLGAMLVVVGAGLGARRVGLLTPRRTARLNAVTFYVALPALIFTSTYDRRPAELASVELLAGMWIAMAATVALAWVVHRREPVAARRSVAIVQSYHSNFGYIGLPLVTAGLGGVAGGKAAVVLGVGALTQIPLTTILLVRINGSSTDPWHEARQLATNPVIVTLLVGLAVASVTWTPPAPASEALGLVARTALPLALLCVGASLTVDFGDADLTDVGSVVGLKVFAMPLVAFLAYLTLDVDAVTMAVGVVMLATPTAVSTYIYAGELGGDTNLASANVLATTLVGVVTLSGLLFLFA